MVPFVTCKQYYRAITPHVNAIKQQVFWQSDSVSTENESHIYNI